jgi:hypothetical protein
MIALAAQSTSVVLLQSVLVLAVGTDTTDPAERASKEKKDRLREDRGQRAMRRAAALAPTRGRTSKVRCSSSRASSSRSRKRSYDRVKEEMAQHCGYSGDIDAFPKAPAAYGSAHGGPKR